MLPAVSMNLYWTQRVFFHFLSRQNNGAFYLWSWRWQNWLRSLLFENAFMVLSQVGCSCGSHPHCARTPCGLWCTILTAPLWEENVMFFPLGRWGTDTQRQKGAFPALCASSCSGILNHLLQGVVKCLRPSSELPFGPFSYRKFSVFAFLTSNKSCTDLTEWGQYGQVPLLHGH